MFVAGSLVRVGIAQMTCTRRSASLQNLASGRAGPGRAALAYGFVRQVLHHAVRQL